MKDLAFRPEAEMITEILRGVRPHEILLLDQHASISEAKARFKQIALRLHPDKHAGADACEAFKRVNNALQSYVPAEAKHTRHVTMSAI
jgi:DnaJ-class molecular chaperone